MKTSNVLKFNPAVETTREIDAVKYAGKPAAMKVVSRRMLGDDEVFAFSLGKTKVHALLKDVGFGQELFVKLADTYQIVGKGSLTEKSLPVTGAKFSRKFSRRGARLKGLYALRVAHRGHGAFYVGAGAFTQWIEEMRARNYEVMPLREIEARFSEMASVIRATQAIAAADKVTVVPLKVVPKAEPKVATAPIAKTAPVSVDPTLVRFNRLIDLIGGLFDRVDTAEDKFDAVEARLASVEKKLDELAARQVVVTIS